MADEKKASGHAQTPKQAAMTDLGREGRTDSDRARDRAAGHDTGSPGGSSQGESDRKPSTR